MSKKSVNVQTFYNVLASAVRSGVLFITMPLFTRLLGPEQYGLFSVFSSWLLLIICFISLGAGQGLATGRYEFKDDYFRFRSSILLFGSLVSLSIIAVVFILRRPLAGVLGYSTLFTVLLFVTAFAHFILDFVQSALVYEKKAKLNFILSVSLLISTVGLSLLLIVKGNFKELYYGRVYGSTLPYIVFAAVLWFLVFLKKPAGCIKEYWKYSIMIGFPLVFHSLSQNVLAHSDRIMLQYLGYAGATVGIYSFYQTYCGITSTLLNAFNTSWCPFYYDDLDERAFDRLKGKVRNYLELFTVIVCGFLLLAREVSYLFADSEYYAGMNLIPVFVMAVYFQFMYQFPVNFEFFNKKTTIIAVGTCASALINVALNWLLIPRFGMYGAAVATAASYSLLFVAHYIIVKRIRVMKFHMKLSDFLPGFLTVVVAAALFYLLEDFWYIRWGLGAALGIYELMHIIKRKSIF